MEERIMKTKLISFSIFVFCFIQTTFALDTIRIVTWNIEHLGSPGRGLGGIGSGSLQLRTESQLKEIARFIRDDLTADLLALQEVAITDTSRFGRFSDPLEIIVRELGADWTYHIGNPGNEIQMGSIHNMQNAFLWNMKKVHAEKIMNFHFSNDTVGRKRLFDRLPLVGYFQALKNGQNTNDFVIVNLHLASGQDNDENHLAAIVIVEQNISNLLKLNNINESDRIILGDFNDNPFAKDQTGVPIHLDLTYKYLESQKYDNLVTESMKFTRLNNEKSSIIDHIFVNSSIKSRHLNGSIERFLPDTSSTQNLANWRRNYSDHLPLIINIKVANQDDDVD